MNKKCIFNSSITCNDCGECYICELDKKKNCNNCGKCLELDGVDIRAIKIEEIMEKGEEADFSAETSEDKVEESCSDILKGKDLSEDDPVWEYIDDIKDLSQCLKEEDLSKNAQIVENFPGFITFKSKN